MKVKIIDDDGEWNVPLRKIKNSQFLQSWEWGVFQQTFNRSAHRLQIIEGSNVMASWQCFEHALPGGRHYLYAPHGPVFLTEDETLYDTIVQRLYRAMHNIASERRTVFSRFEPVSLQGLRINHFTPLGFKPVKSIQPSDEIAVKVKNSEEKLIKSMHEKTRYNIRVADKRGVNIRLIEEENYARRVFPMFWGLLQATAKKQGIRTHSREYYLRMVNLLMPNRMIKFMVAEYDNEIIAVNLLGIFGDTVYYLHGGSSYKHRALMAPFALHWEGMRLAKKLNKTYYNLGGVSPAGAENHPWRNLTRFKEGFVALNETGERFNYIGGLDLVHKPFGYKMYGATRKLRRFVRRRSSSSS